MVTKDAVLSRHHHLTLFWKHSAHMVRWALNKIREGEKEKTKLPLLVYDDHMPRVSREATDILITIKKLKNSKRCLVTEKQAIYRKDM